MEWLQNLLSNAVYGEDGKLDVEATMKKINEEAPKHIIPKEQYNTKVNELKAANDTLTALKKENEGNDDLQGKVKEYEGKMKALQKQNDDLQKTYRLKEAISSSGCTDADYLIYKHGGIDKFAFDEDGKPTDVENVVKTYKESTPMLFGQIQHTYRPKGGTGGSEKNPFSKESWNMTEQGKLLTENPAQAKELAAAAGISI